METKTENIQDKKTQLLNSEDFEKALTEAAEVKMETMTSCKTRNRDNYTRFYEAMLATNPDIQKILDTKKKNRTDSEEEMLKNWKKDMSGTYKQVCDLIAPEDLEEGDLTKVQKIVKKVTQVLRMLDYIGHHEMENEFNRNGIKLVYDKLSDQEAFQNKNIEKVVNDVFTVGKTIKEDMNSKAQEIKDVIYTQSVPLDLQYDKSMNKSGLKSSDFSKLVDIKAKILMANSDEAKDKLSEQMNDIAGDYVFQNKKNEMMSQKILEMMPDEQ